MKLRQLAESIGAKTAACPDADIRELFMDSRQTVRDGLFFCISGSTFDGHRFARQAVEKGACALVVEHPVDGISVPSSKWRTAGSPWRWPPRNSTAMPTGK